MIKCDVCHKEMKKDTRNVDFQLLSTKLTDVCFPCLCNIADLVQNFVKSRCLTCGKNGVHAHEVHS